MASPLRLFPSPIQGNPRRPHSRRPLTGVSSPSPPSRRPRNFLSGTSRGYSCSLIKQAVLFYCGDSLRQKISGAGGAENSRGGGVVADDARHSALNTVTYGGLDNWIPRRRLTPARGMTSFCRFCLNLSGYTFMSACANRAARRQGKARLALAQR